MASFANATETSPTLATDYLPGNSGWSGMDGAGGSLNWLLGPWEGSGYTLSLEIPIIPTNSSGTAVATLAQGATGAFNSYYVTLAQTLISPGDLNAYLRLGWEFDGSWMPWNATTPAAEASYASYFQQIVTAMRSISGAAFRFVWNPDAGAFTESGYSVAAAYPGNAYVDVIGLDTYDQSWATPPTAANAWSSTTLPSLTAAQEYASAHGKPVAFTEWGLSIRSDGHGLGDDPYYIDHMVSWMQTASNDVAFESYFDCNAGGVNSLMTGGLFPNGLAAFSSELGSTPPHHGAEPEAPGIVPSPPPGGGLLSARWSPRDRVRRVVLERRVADVPEDRRMRALGTTVSVPCDWGSTKLNVMLFVAPAGMLTVAPTSRVGPSGPW